MISGQSIVVTAAASCTGTSVVPAKAGTPQPTSPSGRGRRACAAGEGDSAGGEGCYACACTCGADPSRSAGRNPAYGASDRCSACVSGSHAAPLALRDPHLAVREVLLLPHRHHVLDAVDHVQPREERLEPVRRANRHREAHVLDLQPSDAVPARYRRDVEPRHRLLEYLADDLRGHTLVGLVLQPQHRTTRRVVARRPLERDDSAVERPPHRVSRLSGVDLVRADPHVHPAAHRRIERDIVAIRQRVRQVAELLVHRDEVRLEVARQRRGRRQQRLDRIRDHRAVVQRQRHPVHTRGLAVRSVEADQHVHGWIIPLTLGNPESCRRV